MLRLRSFIICTKATSYARVVLRCKGIQLDRKKDKRKGEGSYALFMEIYPKILVFLFAGICCNDDQYFIGYDRT